MRMYTVSIGSARVPMRAESASQVDELAKANPSDVLCDLNKCKGAHEAVSDLYRHAFEEDLIDESLKKVQEEWQE